MHIEFAKNTAYFRCTERSDGFWVVSTYEGEVAEIGPFDSREAALTAVERAITAAGKTFERVWEN